MGSRFLTVSHDPTKHWNWPEGFLARSLSNATFAQRILAA